MQEGKQPEKQKQDSKIVERMDKFKEYLASEISARKNASTHNIMMSKVDYTALMRLYRCSEKGSVYFDGLVNLSDKDIAQAVQYFIKLMEIDNFAALTEWASRVKKYADILARRQKDGRKAITRDEFYLLVKLKDKYEDLGKKARPFVLVMMSLFCEECSDDFTPKTLLKELDDCVERLEKIMADINLTNSQTFVEGKSLTEIIARKDALMRKLTVYRSLISQAGYKTMRARGSEIKILSTVNVASLQKKADDISKEIRQLDNTLQENNWKSDLLER